MKAGLLAVAAFSAVAVALPHVHRHEKRDVEVVYATQVEVVTATAPAAYVYVDQNGNAVEAPASTPAVAPVVNGKWGGDHQGHGQDHPAPAPVVQATQAPAPVVQAPAPVVEAPSVAPVVVNTPAVVVPAVASSAAPVASSAPVTGSGPYAGMSVTYSPYTSGPCKSAGQIKSDIAGLTQFSIIRLYGTDCDQISSVMDNLAPGQSVMLGLFNIDGRLSSDMDSMIKQVGNRWDRVSAINVGNEAIGNGQGDAGSVTAAVKTARGTLQKYFNGPIATVDIVDHYTNGALCGTADKDTVFANAHPFFAKVDADNAGSFVAQCISDIKAKCGVSNVIITETGWPSGTKLPDAVVNRVATMMPAEDMQAKALEKIRTQFAGDKNIFFFSAYNEDWKPISIATLGVEQNWGILSTH